MLHYKGDDPKAALHIFFTDRKVESKAIILILRLKLIPQQLRCTRLVKDDAAQGVIELLAKELDRLLVARMDSRGVL